MLDIKWIRENKAEFEKQMEKRGVNVNSEELLDLDEERRQLTTVIQSLQKSKNDKSKRLASLRGKPSREFEDIKIDVGHINERLDELSKQLTSSDELKKFMDNLPNIPDADVPQGSDESMNMFLHDFMRPNKIENAKEHFEIGKNLGMMDFEQTAKISGSRFVTLRGDLAKLERALISFMIDVHTGLGFEEISAPSLVRPKAMYNVGQLPKFEQDSYATTDEKYRLIPTGEVPLTNMVADTMLAREELPMRFTAYTPCYRSEAGSAGKDTRGMIRNHQFGKVELVSIAAPEESEKEHEHMLGAAEEILKRLEIPYRVMLLCSGDMGFSAKKTYDIEAWLPGQGKYREISSVSNCGDFQARRMKARYKEAVTGNNILVHTLNGSGLAVGRTMIAILENYQNQDGSVNIPQALVPYMGGMTKIEKK